MERDHEKKKMKKWKIITLLVFAFVIQVVWAVPTYDMCEDTVIVNTNCTMITPSLECTSYTYNITNSTGGDFMVEDSTLTVLNGSVYYFNFTELAGSYIITLCDGTTREVKVEEEEHNMLLAAIILMPLVIAFLLFYMSTKLKDEDHWAMSLGLMLLGFVFILVSWGLGIQIVAKYLNFPELQETLGTSLFSYGSFFYLIIVYFLVYVMIMVLRVVRNKKRKKVGNYEQERQD